MTVGWLGILNLERLQDHAMGKYRIFYSKEPMQHMVTSSIDDKITVNTKKHEFIEIELEKDVMTFFEILDVAVSRYVDLIKEPTTSQHLYIKVLEYPYDTSEGKYSDSHMTYMLMADRKNGGLVLNKMSTIGNLRPADISFELA